MRVAVFAFSAVLALVCSAPASALMPHCSSGICADQATARHQPQPEPDVRRHEPPDPCRQFHTPQAHARCLARNHSHLGPTARDLEQGRFK